MNMSRKLISSIAVVWLLGAVPSRTTFAVQNEPSTTTADVLETQDDSDEDWRILLQKAQVMSNLDQPTNAAGQLQRAYQVAPDVAAASTILEALCRELVKTGEPDQAIQTIYEAISLRPEFVHESLYWLGRAHFQKREFKAAMSFLSEFRERTANPLDSAYWLGRCHFERSEYETAFAYFQKIAEAFPSEATYRYWLGRTSYWLLDFETAITCFQLAGEFEPGDSDNWWWLAKAFVAAGDMDSAAITAGRLWFDAGDSPRAEKLLRDFRRFAPDSLEIKRQVARLRFGQGRFADALPMLESVANHPLAEPLDRSYLGWCHLTLANFDQALQQFEIVLSSPPDEFLAFEGYAWTQLAMGKPELSRKFFETLRGIESGSRSRTETGLYWARRIVDGTTRSEDSASSGGYARLGLAAVWNNGLRVLFVVEGSPADAAGIRAGDLITKINGADISANRNWEVELESIAERPRVLVAFLRGDQPLARMLSLDDQVPGPDTSVQAGESLKTGVADSVPDSRAVAAVWDPVAIIKSVLNDTLLLIAPFVTFGV